MLVAAAGLALLTAACGTPGTPSTPSTLSTSRTPSTAVAYSSCMRSRGVPRYPDPSRGNELADGLPKVDPRQLGVSDAQYQSAQGDCAHLLPNGGQQAQAQSQRDLDAMRAYARCMRAHGVPTWPDPTFDSTAGWGFNLVGVHGFDPNSPQIDAKMDVCSRRLPPGTGVPLSRPGHPG